MEPYGEPRSRNERILQNILGAEYEMPPPESRTEILLQAILEQGGSGGGDVKPLTNEQINELKKLL